MQKDMEQQLQELLDKRACEEVILRYGRTLDWLDSGGQTDCYWPDAEIDYGFFEGTGQDWVPVVMEVESAAPRRWHVSTGVMVQVDGDRAKSECYGISVGSTTNEDGTLTDTMFGGRYLDELEKRNGEWRISKRVYIADWIQHFPHGLDALTETGFTLKILQIAEGGHELYRKL